MSKIIHSVLQARADLSFIGNGAANTVFGGSLKAWAFNQNGTGEVWYEDFRATVVSAIGKRFLPIYRMGDGEYRFLMGRKYNRRKRPHLRELIGYILDTSGIRKTWKTSWGESYSAKQMMEIKARLLQQINAIAKEGYLALFLYDNGIHAFEEYNRYVEPFFARHNIFLNESNHIPFHFPVNILSDQRSDEFFENKHLLIATSFSPEQRAIAEKNLKDRGAKKVSFIQISATSSMIDSVDLNCLDSSVDLCFVAAGIGAANIICQLSTLQCPTIDVGGFVRCFIDKDFISHCLFRFAWTTKP